MHATNGIWCAGEPRWPSAFPSDAKRPRDCGSKIQVALTARKRIASVLPRRLVSYCRYADDYVAVLCQHSKLEAQQLKTAMAEWLERQLGLTQHPLTTRITHWD